ncbi:hypothetical protein LA080_000002 [Diaporthe eres]|nr:hypothetical protein LA080_000002 [Diaporthe eres]
MISSIFSPPLWGRHGLTGLQDFQLVFHAPTTILKTIPAAWSPSPACLGSTDLWEWQKDITAPYVLGGPVETSSCYPPGYTGATDASHQATACPTGFSQACVDADLTTRCSTAYNFVCNHNTGFAFLGATTFPSTSQWPTEGLTTTITLTYTQLGPRAQSVASYVVTRYSDSSTVTFTTSGSFTTTEVVSDGGTLYAMAVVIIPPTQTTSQSTTSKAGSLSSAAAIGLGVGVAVGVLVLAASAFFVYHRSRRARQPSPTTAGHGSQDAVLPQLEDVHRKPDLAQPVEMAVYERPGELHS